MELVMSRQVVLELPDETLAQVERVAARVHREVNELLAETVTAAFVSSGGTKSLTVAELSDEQVLRIADSKMQREENELLSTLLDLQQQRDLTELETSELDRLIDAYGEGTVRKSEALAEAVRRGLRPPLRP
jgi:hypothetical protein